MTRIYREGEKFFLPVTIYRTTTPDLDGEVRVTSLRSHDVTAWEFACADLLVPAERVTITPAPYIPEPGTEVTSTFGSKGVILPNDGLLNGQLPIRWLTPPGYGRIYLSDILPPES